MIYLTLALLLVAALVAILLKDNLLSVLSLATVSALLSIVFFQLGAPVAGVFELSVGAGLITVLVILTISFLQERREKGPGHWLLWSVLSLTVVVCLLYLFQVLSSKIYTSPVPPAGWGQVGSVLWKMRSFDLLPQVLIILAAAFGILAMLRPKAAAHTHTEGEE